MTTAQHGRATVRRVTPAAEINAQYNAFASDFATVENLYVKSLTEQSTGTVPVTTTVMAAYTAGSNVMQVVNASVFFPPGAIPPVTATATGPSGSVLGFFSFQAILDTTTLSVNVPPASSLVNLPVGTLLTASVPPSSQASAASLFPSFITNRANQMAIDLVQYFNSLPLKLPYFNTPPHTPNNRGAIQNYIYSSIAGSGTTSLLQSLLAIPLPTTAGTDLQIYNLTVVSAIEQSRIQTLNGVSEIYARQLRVAAPIPNNRYGVISSGTIPSYILASP